MGSWNYYKTLLEVVLEIGDLNNIEPYEILKSDNGGCEFKTDEGWDVKAWVEEINIDVVKSDTDTPAQFYRQYSFDKWHDRKIYNVVYAVEENQSQYKVSDLKTLYRIIKTVSLFVKSFIEHHKPFAVFVISTNKDNNRGRNSKYDYYNRIIDNMNMNDCGTLPITKNDGRRGFVIYKTSKKK